MSIVALLDQRGSRRGDDLVATMSHELNEALVEGLYLPFVRTAGDEMQGVVRSGEALAAIASRALENGHWWIGVGFGEIEDGTVASAREARGPAFWHARDALARAHQRKGGSPGPIAVVGKDPDIAEDLETAFSAIAFIVARRTARQREAVAVARETSSRGLRLLAARLDVTVSAASQLMRASGYVEQCRLERLVARHAEQIA